MDKEDITVDVVRALMCGQFPAWAELPLRPVDVDGNDNTSFRLGNDLLVRLPSHERSRVPTVFYDRAMTPVGASG